MTETTSSSMALEDKFGGSVFGLNGIYCILVLKAVAQGTDRVTFRSINSPAQTVTFSFRIEA